MTVVVNIEVKAADGRRQELMDKLASILPDTQAFEGCLSVEVVVPRDDDDSIWLLERWEAIDNYHAYKAWRGETGTSVLASDLVDGPPRATIADPFWPAS